VIDGSTNLVIATIDVGSGPAAVGVNPKTNRVYVAQQGGGVAVINGRTTRCSPPSRSVTCPTGWPWSHRPT